MNSPEKLAVYIVPSRHVRYGFEPMPSPYERIIGVRKVDGGRLWSTRMAPGDEAEPVKADDANEKLIVATPEFVERFIGFFGDKVLPPVPVNAYNCHSFGQWMIGAATADGPEAQKSPDYLVVDGTPTFQSLPLGTRGAIGRRFRGVACASHTIVGLGQESSECIQVVATDSYLGITPYDDVRNYYDPANDPRPSFSEDYTDFGLYV